MQMHPRLAPAGVTGILAALVLPVLLAACSSGGSGSASTSSPALQRTCQQISAIFSDGPDPDADPVGYAESQILPLQGVRTSDATLQRAINALVSADQTFYADNGAGKAVKRAVTDATDTINQLCPGVSS
jgi:hypothetical protein